MTFGIDHTPSFLWYIRVNGLRYPLSMTLHWNSAKPWKEGFNQQEWIFRDSVLIRTYRGFICPSLSKDAITGTNSIFDTKSVMLVFLFFEVIIKQLYKQMFEM